MVKADEEFHQCAVVGRGVAKYRSVPRQPHAAPHSFGVLHEHDIAVAVAAAVPHRLHDRGAAGRRESVDPALDRGKIGRPLEPGDGGIVDFPMEDDQHAGDRLEQPEDRRADAEPAVDLQDGERSETFALRVASVILRYCRLVPVR